MLGNPSLKSLKPTLNRLSTTDHDFAYFRAKIVQIITVCPPKLSNIGYVLYTFTFTFTHTFPFTFTFIFYFTFTFTFTFTLQILLTTNSRHYRYVEDIDGSHVCMGLIVLTEHLSEIPFFFFGEHAIKLFGHTRLISCACIVYAFR